jgi:hypothetical protein
VLALDAQDVTRTLWTSEQFAQRDRLGLFAKFNPPVVANGKVFVATYGDDEPRRTYPPTRSAALSRSLIAAKRSCVSRRRFVMAALAAVLLLTRANFASALDQSPPPILQWFESSYQAMEERMADVFLAGYGFIWVPPPFRADQGNFSVGYDVYDRFDLGAPGRPTLYGTEAGLKALARILHRAGLGLHVDFVINHNTIVVFDPRTNEQGIAVHSFNLEEPMAGDPIIENATGYLMRNAQWLIQVIGVDGLRIDAAKHVQGFVLDFLDRAVYRQNPRKLLDGSQSDVFTYSEVFDANPAVLLPHVKKTIDHANPGRIGGNRDTLDFKLYFALKDNLERTGVPEAWQHIKDAALDVSDDGLHNGSAGVSFIQNHDVFKPFALEHVAQAYTLMMPGNTIVYCNGREFGDNRDFPKPGRGDALSVGPGSMLTRLLAARTTHGRGNYAERWDGTDGLFAFERQGSALVLLSNRGDAGFDSRTLTHVGFRPGTLLLELSGNAADRTVNPDRGGHTDIPEVVQVFEEGGVAKVNVRFQRPGTLSNAGEFSFHGKGFLIYGLPTPQSDKGLELTNVAQVLPGRPDPTTDRENGRQRQADISVIRSDAFEVRLRTKPVRLLGSAALRDVSADGDEALLRLDDGRDLNGNGVVDFRTPGTPEYGFERFVSKHQPLIGNHDVHAPRGDGEFR